MASGIAIVSVVGVSGRENHKLILLPLPPLSLRRYEGNGPANGAVGEDDSIDVPMPYFMSGEQFVPDPKKCSSKAMGKNSDCQKCLGSTFNNRECVD